MSDDHDYSIGWVEAAPFDTILNHLTVLKNRIAELEAENLRLRADREVNAEHDRAIAEIRRKETKK